MSIALSLPGLASIEEYNGLIEFIVEHLELDEETTERIPTFIRLSENRLERLLTVPERETSVQLTASEGSPYASFPADLRQLRAVFDDQGVKLDRVALFDSREVIAAGRPTKFTTIGDQLWLSPTPDSTYALNAVYLTKVPALTEANTTNWLLSRHADVYVYSILAQAEAFLGNAQNAGAWTAAADGVIAEINDQAMRARSAGPLVMRPRVVV